MIQSAEKEGDVNALKQVLKEAVSGFVPEKEIVDILHLQKNI